MARKGPLTELQLWAHDDMSASTPFVLLWKEGGDWAYINCSTFSMWQVDFMVSVDQDPRALLRQQGWTCIWQAV